MNVNDEFDPAKPSAQGDGPDLPPLPAAEEARVRAALAGLGPAAGGAEGEARPAFRAALRARFVDGSIEAPVEAPGRPVLGAPAAARRPRVVRPWMGALAAAALLAVVVFAWLPRPETAPSPGWSVVALTADSTAGASPSLRVDGRDVAVAAMEPGRAALKPGARIELPDGVAMELRLDGILAFETSPGASFTVPTDGPARVAAVDRGEVRYVTGPGFRGTRLAVESPEARVEATGTSFVLITAPEMTCVCVGEGRVRVVARGGQAADTLRTKVEFEIPAGRRREVYADGTMSAELPVHAHEAAHMAGLRARMDAAASGASRP